MMPKVKRYANFYHLPCRPLGEDGRIVTNSPKHHALARRAAAEGMVLLKNTDHVLPLSHHASVALFGLGSVGYVKGGSGSGDVNTDYVPHLYDALAEKEAEGKGRCFKPLQAFYTKVLQAEEKQMADNYEEILKIREELTNPSYVEKRPEAERRWRELSRTVEPEISDAMIDEAAQFADTAIVVISRRSSEGMDRSAEEGDFYLSPSENKLLDGVTSRFAHTIVILNVGSIIDTRRFLRNDVDALLLMWQAGSEGCRALADILYGDVNPSGKLCDTFADDYSAYPSASTFNTVLAYEDYHEDIYVGYRYFDTIPGAADHVLFPFGFGLSYTEFSFSHVSGRLTDDRITVSVDVTNIGKVAGKEVVQVYYSAPMGLLGKPNHALCGFAKTKLLAPGETQHVDITFAASMMASYDDIGRHAEACFLLEQGDYRFFVGNALNNLTEIGYVYHVDEPYRITERLAHRCAPKVAGRRLRADGSYEDYPAVASTHKHITPKIPTVEPPADALYFYDVTNEDELTQFMAQLTDDELTELVGGQPSTGLCNTGSFAGQDRLRIPYIGTADGPAGLRIDADCGVPTTAWPCAAMLSCSFNEEIVAEVGKAAAMEVKENHFGVWLAPGMNIHRNPLCGRNFEYFSEDPYLTGKMAAAVTRAVQSVKVAVSIKHFAANNRECLRETCDSRMSERALREIYLRGFEICVKEAAPMTLMSSYNRLNGVQTSENEELLTCILRDEWGFDGMVTTDWWVKNHPAEEVKAGNDIKMGIGYPEDLKAALADGSLKRADLYVCVRRILQMIMRLA